MIGVTATVNRLQFSKIAGFITAAIPFDPFLVPDGSAVVSVASVAAIDAANTADYSASDGFTIQSVTVSYELTETGTPAGPNDTLDPQQQMTVSALVVASDGQNTIQRTFTAQGIGIHAEHQATAGTEVISVAEGSAPLIVPFANLFEVIDPAATDWSSDILTVTVSPALAGIEVQATGLLLDPEVLVVQANTAITVTGAYSVTEFGQTVSYTADKAIDLTVTASTIALAESPRVGDAATLQLFQGETVNTDPELTNRAAIISTDPDLWTGLGTPGFRVFRTRVNNNPSEILTLIAQEGDTIRPLADGYVDGRTPGDGLGGADRTFIGADVTVEEYLTLTPSGDGRLVSAEVNPNVPVGRELVGLQINGQDVLPGITPANFASTTTMTALTQGALSFQVDGAVGDNLLYDPPVVFAPPGSEVTWTFDLIDNADQSVILADQTFTGAQLVTAITVGIAGKTVYWRAKARSVGLADLDIDSPTIAVPVSYTLREYDTTANSQFNFPYASSPRAQMSMWINPALLLDGQLSFAPGSRWDWRLQQSGLMRILVEDDTNTRILDVQATAALTSGTLQHIAIRVDLSVPSFGLYINGQEVGFTTNTPLSAGSGNIAGSTMNMYSLGNGADRLDAIVGDVVFQIGTLTDPTVLYNGGTPQAVLDSGLYHIGGDLTAAQINTGANNGTATVTVDAGNMVDV